MNLNDIRLDANETRAPTDTMAIRCCSSSWACLIRAALEDFMMTFFNPARLVRATSGFDKRSKSLYKRSEIALFELGYPKEDQSLTAMCLAGRTSASRL